MANQSFVILDRAETQAGTAVANTTTETALFGNTTIPANTLQNGKAKRLTVYAKHSTTGTPTLTLSVKLGTTLICKTGAVTTGSGVTNALIKFQVDLQVQTNGSSGTVMGNGTAYIHGGTAPTVGSATGAPAIAPMTNGGQTVPAAATEDFTSDKALSVTAQWGTASASNTITGLQYTIEDLN